MAIVYFSHHCHHHSDSLCNTTVLLVGTDVSNFDRFHLAFIGTAENT